MWASDAEGWPSGLRRTPGKCVYVNAYREFESHPFRHFMFQGIGATAPLKCKIIEALR